MMTVKQEEEKLGTSKGCEGLAGFSLSPLFALILCLMSHSDLIQGLHKPM